MRKYYIIIGLLALLIQLFSGCLVQTADLQAQEPDEGGKISSLLALQVEAKLRAAEAGGAPAALEESLQAGHVDILQAPGTRLEDLDKQQIFIHLAQKPSRAQVEELEVMGITLYLDSWIPPVGAHPTGFLLADMPVDKLWALASEDYVVKLDTAERLLEPQNDLATEKINADDVWGSGYEGTGVRIAVLDSGLDVTHSDIHPALVSSKDYSNYPTLDDTIANQVSGHGTHVTGSALGRGAQSSGVYKGSAPDADLIFLKIGDDTTGDASTAAMVNAIKDAVDVYNADIITVSYGGWDTYHDGTSEEAQAVDYAVSQGAVVFIAAGNRADDDQHYSGTVSPYTTSGYIPVNVNGAGTNNTALVYNLVWYDGTGTSNDLELEYYDPLYNLLPSTSGTQSESSRGTESEASYYDYYVDPGGSTYYLKVKNKSPNSQFFHIYYYSGFNLAGAGWVAFDRPDPDYTIDSPADADSAIAVGAYNTRQTWYDYTNDAWWCPDDPVDQITSFSSRGPRVDTGAPPKPNIVAPGSVIISARDTDIYTWPSAYDGAIIDDDGPNEDSPTKNDGSGPADYFVMQGTSMACPMAAGAGALILEINPGWTPAQVKQALETTAIDKGAYGWDTIYGWGLIDVFAAGSGTTPPTMEAILEPQGQYYNTAPSFSNFGFDDDVALNNGGYQIDSYQGEWAVLFTDVTGTSWDNDGWTIPGFDALAEGNHTIYFMASDDAGNVEGESGEWSWWFSKDTTPHQLTIGVGGTGTTDPSPGTYIHDCGTEVTITAIATDPCWKFNHFMVDGDKHTENPITIHMDSDKGVIAYFTRIRYQLTIGVDGTGTTDPSPGTYTYDCGTEVTITAIETDPCWEFSHFMVDGEKHTENPITIHMDSDKNVTAYFTRIRYPLTIGVDGTGTTDPSPGTYTYDCGTEVTITAIATNSCWKFDHFMVDGEKHTENPITIHMDSNKSVTAYFTSVPWTYTFEDPRRGTKLYINTDDKTFQFTAPDGYNTGIFYAPRMRVVDSNIIIRYREANGVYFTSYANGEKHACFGSLYDSNIHKLYFIFVGGKLSPKGQPAMFYGTARINGVNVPEGTRITASLKGIGSWSTETWSEDGKSTYCLIIPSDNPRTAKVEGARLGDKLTFKIGDLVAAATDRWIPGGIRELNLTVGAPKPVLKVNPTTLSFTAQESVANPPLQNVSIINAGSGTLSWMATKDAGWLIITPDSGTTPTTVRVSVDISNLDEGNYMGHITISGVEETEDSPQTVVVGFWRRNNKH